MEKRFYSKSFLGFGMRYEHHTCTHQYESLELFQFWLEKGNLISVTLILETSITCIRGCAVDNAKCAYSQKLSSKTTLKFNDYVASITLISFMHE